MNPPACQYLAVSPAVIASLLLFSFSTRGLERLEPAQGCYLGVNPDDSDTISLLKSRLGLTPAVFARFFTFPLTAASREELSAFLNEVRPTRAIAFITLEPFLGLSAVTESACLDLAQLCATNEAQGIQGIMVRFAHEMNGNWYPWGQQPILFKEKFRLLARIIHTNTFRTAMVWAPNNGIGYPFGSDGMHRAATGSIDFAALDTSGDGRLTPSDDMYEPYYPGDDAVDWAGMTIYHWGAIHPFLGNGMPPVGLFASTLRGTASQPAIPDFYARYCSDGLHNKPLVIPETAAFFNTLRALGQGEFQIKQAWWRQAFNAFDDNTNDVNIAEQFPKLKCINWFDHYKQEAEAQNEWIDWRISANPSVREAFVTHVSKRRDNRLYFLTADQVDCSRRTNCITADHLPRILPLTGTLTVSLAAKAAANCDLVVDLLDENFHWHGGTRAAITAGTQTVSVSFAINVPLNQGETYRWSIFLTPSGSNYLGALTWLDSPRPVAGAVPLLRTQWRDGELFLNWESIAGWHYRVFETSDLNTDDWAPLSPELIGTGSTLEMAVPTTAPRKFYRLEVSMP